MYKDDKETTLTKYSYNIIKKKRKKLTTGSHYLEIGCKCIFITYIYLTNGSKRKTGKKIAIATLILYARKMNDCGTRHMFSDPRSFSLVPLIILTNKNADGSFFLPRVYLLIIYFRFLYSHGIQHSYGTITWNINVRFSGIASKFICRHSYYR